MLEGIGRGKGEAPYSAHSKGKSNQVATATVQPNVKSKVQKKGPEAITGYLNRPGLS